MTELKPEELNNLAYEFVKTPFGEYYMQWLQQQADKLIAQADDNMELSPERRIHFYDRATGVKDSTKFMQNHALQHEAKLRKAQEEAKD